jgi:hypothetical protein
MCEKVEGREVEDVESIYTATGTVCKWGWGEKVQVQVRSVNVRPKERIGRPWTFWCESKCKAKQKQKQVINILSECDWNKKPARGEGRRRKAWYINQETEWLMWGPVDENLKVGTGP